MVWKPKEKELTAEEAIAIAKAELTPFWFGSPPLLAAVKTPAGVDVLPLDAKFKDRSWILFFVDLLSSDVRVTLPIIREWCKRYGSYSMGMLLVFRPDYSFLNDPEFIKDFIHRHQITVPVVMDHEGALFEAFQASTIPMVRIQKGSQVFLAQSGKNWHEEVEPKIQKYLRDADPGLSLMPALKENYPQITEVGRIDFTQNKLKNISSEICALSGDWQFGPDYIFTHDEDASIVLPRRAPGIGVIARAMTRSVEPGRVQIDLDGVTVPHSCLGTDVSHDEDGLTSAPVRLTNHYSLAENISASVQKVTLRFPYASQMPLAVYGVRWSER